MENMFLEPEQLQRLTGYKTRIAQIKALNEMGITHKVNAAGDIIVLESHIKKLLDGFIYPAKNEQSPKPNFNGLYNG